MTGRAVRGGLAIAAVIAVTGAVTGPVAHAAPRVPQHRADFNGDGHQDLAVGAPGGTVGSAQGAGYVSVVYGGTHGLDPARHATFSQNSPGVPGAAETRDGFGTTVVPADLDGDGYTDLVVAAPGEDIGPAVDAGMLTILWGGPSGLLPATAVDTGATPHGGLGRILVTGDFDGDGHQDLALRTRSEDVRFLYGTGRDGRPARTSELATWPSEGSVFVRALTAGDVTGDGADDIVVIVNDSDEPDSWRGALYRGGAGGFTRVGILRDPQGYRLSGQSAAIGDLNGDGYGDVVMGHGENIYDSDQDLPTKGGALGIAYGGPDGLSTTLKPAWITQDTAGVPGVAEDYDNMGTSVALADVNGDGYADVLTGVPGETFDGITGAGSVLLLKGTAHGLTGSGARVFSQNSPGVPGVPEKADRFGSTVALLAATTADGAQPVIGDPAENAANGAVWSLRWTRSGPTTTGTVSFGPPTMGAPAAKAQFGAALGQA